MKKLLYSLMITVLLITLTGCNDSKNAKDDNNEKKNYSKMTCISTSDAVADQVKVNIEYEDNYIKNIEYIYNINSNGKTLATMLKDEFEKDFKNVNGVKSNYSNDIWTQTFNFDKINLTDYQNSMTDYLNFMSSSTEKDFSYISDNKVLLDSYKNIELSNYNCN